MQLADKNGPPGMRVTVICQTKGCGHVSVVEGSAADRIVARLWGPAWKGRRPGLLHMRELLGRLTCAKCSLRFSKVTFELVYHRMSSPNAHLKRPWLPDYDLIDDAGKRLDFRRNAGEKRPGRASNALK